MNRRQGAAHLVFISHSTKDRWIARQMARQWVLVELGAALGLQKHVVPIIYNLAPTDIPDIIRLTKAHELNDFEHYLDELVRRVRGTGKK